MAHPIRITDEMIEEMKREFISAIPTMRLSEGKIDFHRNLAEIDRRAVLRFTELAWLKMTVLVSGFDSEVGWHGLARRSETEENTFIVDDILIYPQKVTATTVSPDQVEYQNWLISQPDEIFQNIRFQGHSHVNMGVTPSGVDTAFYDEILSQLEDDMFYIFMIINKREEKHVRIYDMLNNVFYGTKDVTVEVMNEVGLNRLLAEAKQMVTRETYTPAATSAAKNVPVATQMTQNYAGTGGVYGGNKKNDSKNDNKKAKDKAGAKPFGKEYPGYYGSEYSGYDYDGWDAYR